MTRALWKSLFLSNDAGTFGLPHEESSGVDGKSGLHQPLSAYGIGLRSLGSYDLPIHGKSHKDTVTDSLIFEDDRLHANT